MALPKSDKDYSQYTKHLSTMISASALLAGFIFTIITLLLTQLSIPILSSGLTQIALIVLYTLFELMLFLIFNLILMSFSFVSPIPPRSKHIWATNVLWSSSIVATGFLPILLFLLWGLIFTVLLTLFIWIFFFVAAMVIFLRPFLKRFD